MNTCDDRLEGEIAAPLRELNAVPDEVHRARLSAAIDAALDRDQPARQAPGRLGARPVALAAIAAALVAAAWLVVPRTSAPHLAPSAPVPPMAVAPASVTPPMLVPLSPAGAEGTGATLTPSTSLLATAGQRVRATIAARVRLTLVGPGRVSVLPAQHEGELDVALDGGRLLVDYDGRAGGALRVRSPGAVTTVVGTLFAVDVTPFGSRVAVAHGRVRTQGASGEIWEVAAGYSWVSTNERLSPMPQDLAMAMRQHQADWSEGVPGAQAPQPPRRPTRVAHPVSAPAADSHQPDLDALYAQAEAAMRRRSTGEARRALETVAARDAGGPLGEMALLDLARLALADGDRQSARVALARLPASLHDPALNETADHLKCRAAAADAATRAAGCRAVP